MTNQPTTHPKLETVTVGELEVGDIVHEHGMVLLVDQAPTLSKAHAGDRTYYTAAIVTNRDQVSNDSVPFAFTEPREVWHAAEHRWIRPTTGEHRWTLQGNDLGTVAREVQN